MNDQQRDERREERAAGRMEDREERRRFTFNPSISFDGVAILIACVGCVFWFASLSSTVKQHGEDLKHHDQILEALSSGQKAQNENMAIQSQNIAVLTALVNERTRKP